MIFVRDRDYRELSPAEGGRKYRFTLLRDLESRMPYRLTGRFSFRDSNGHEWMRFENDRRIIRANYSWNGCSPKRHVPVFGWIGTPDTADNLYGSVIHDSGYQFSGTPYFSLSREMEDDFFLMNLRKEGFKLACVYHKAVRYCGGAAFGRNPNGLVSLQLPVPKQEPT